MMTRLKVETRRIIASRVVSSVRAPREASFERAERALALRLTIARYGKDVFDRCRALPDGWLMWHQEILLDYQVRIQMPRPRMVYIRRNEYDEFSRSDVHLKLTDAAPLPNSFQVPWVLSDLCDLCDEVYERYALRADLMEELRLLRTQVTATLSAFSTVESLAAEWPEGYAFFPHEVLAESGALPAPRLSDLNERIEKLRAVV
jgi:hypothetical protein